MGTYLGVTDLQCPRVQLFDPGVVRGHQHAVFPPQDGGGGVSRHGAAEDHRAVHSHRLIDRALTDDRWRAVRHDCREGGGGGKRGSVVMLTKASRGILELLCVATRARETIEIQLEEFLIIEQQELN